MINQNRYNADLLRALEFFWSTREDQSAKSTTDVGRRSDVTAAGHMDGFVGLFKRIAVETGVPEDYVKTGKIKMPEYLTSKKTGSKTIPGFFRPAKEWDLVITSPKNRLIACLELKSMVGSFGKNFNNRAEEAIGSAFDFKKAFEKNAFPFIQKPWIGYLMVVQSCEESTRPARVAREKPLFKVMGVFENTSYLDRFEILCQRLMLEEQYNNTALIYTERQNGKIKHECKNDELSFETFVNAYIGYLKGRMHEFKGRTDLRSTC